jgi:DNA-binding CsgD family transcriptional regulator
VETLHASLPRPPDDGRVAVVLEPATGGRSATVRLEAFGATVREREVATLLALGLSRAEIAEKLVVSPYTVEDHIRSLYEKLGVTSRQELVARVFLDEYLPEVVRQTPLTSRVRFDRTYLSWPSKMETVGSTGAKSRSQRRANIASPRRLILIIWSGEVVS